MPCGEGGEENGAPSDFAVTVEHVDGSVPPPGHSEGTLTARVSGDGRLSLQPDLGGPEPVSDEIREVVPEAVWERLWERRDAYAKRRYGEVP